VFDGIANLFEPSPAPAPEPVPPQPGLFDSPPPPASSDSAAASAEDDRSEIEIAGPEPDAEPGQATPSGAQEPRADEAPTAQPAAGEAAEQDEDKEPAPASEPAAGPPPEPARQEPLLEDFLTEPPRRRRLASAAWTLLALVALAALGFQAAVRFRAELAVLAPQARGALEAACRVARCELRLPRRVEFVTIESSELQADPRRENVIELDAVIRNRAPFAQEYPSLELTLTDDADNPVVRRVLSPREYLGPAAAPLAAGMGAQSETPVRMRFDNSQARATGYKLYLFYP
jgi:hypothetical protein